MKLFRPYDGQTKMMTRKRADLKVGRIDYLALLEEKEIPYPEQRSPRWKAWYDEYIRFMEGVIPPAERGKFQALLLDVLNERHWCKLHGIDYVDPHIHLAALKLCQERWMQKNSSEKVATNPATLRIPSCPKKSKEDVKRILVVDDEEPIRQLMEEMLSILGYHAITCESGVQALTKVQEQRPDMVFLDLFLPDENGLNILPALLKNIPDLPVVILTGVPSLETAQEAMRRGARDYISKPFDIELLQETISDILLHR